MSDPTFALGTFASSKGRFAGLVMRNDVVDLSEGHKLFAASGPLRQGILREPISVACGAIQLMSGRCRVLKKSSL
jgi:hypothetical protein